MRPAPLLVALLVAACSSNPSTTATGAPSALRTSASAIAPVVAPTSLRPSPEPSATKATAASPSPTARRTSAAPVASRSSSPSPKPSPKPSPTHVSKTWLMTIMGYAYDPDTPSIHVGDRIKVTNKDPAIHSFTAKNGSFDTGLLGLNGTRTLTFSKAGVFDFYCTEHPSSMTGQLSVTA